MKKFHLFVFDTYYPSGGLDDYQGSFETCEEAQKTAEKLRYDYYQILVNKEDGSLGEYESGKYPL